LIDVDVSGVTKLDICGRFDEIHVLEQVSHARFAVTLVARSDHVDDIHRDVCLNKIWEKKNPEPVLQLELADPFHYNHILYAGGMLPIRLLGQHEPDDTTDRQMYGNCACSRDILNQFIKGRYDYIDGLINAEGASGYLMPSKPPSIINLTCLIITSSYRTMLTGVPPKMSCAPSSIP
jgi:hypothetical protein